MEKVTLSKSTAEAIETMRAKGLPLNEIVERHIRADHLPVNGYMNVAFLSTDTLIRALYIGYEVVETPLDKVAEYVTRLRNTRNHAYTSKEDSEKANLEVNGALQVLEYLGIKIEGVNT